MRILNNHFTTFTQTLWIHVELLLHSSMNCIISGFNLACYTSIIFKDFLKNAEKLHLKKANGSTNNSLLSSKHFVYCECHTVRKLCSKIYFLFIKKLPYSWTNPNMATWSPCNVCHIWSFLHCPGMQEETHDCTALIKIESKNLLKTTQLKKSPLPTCALSPAFLKWFGEAFLFFRSWLLLLLFLLLLLLLTTCSYAQAYCWFGSTYFIIQ